MRVLPLLLQEDGTSRKTAVKRTLYSQPPPTYTKACSSGYRVPSVAFQSRVKLRPSDGSWAWRHSTVFHPTIT